MALMYLSPSWTEKSQIRACLATAPTPDRVPQAVPAQPDQVGSVPRFPPVRRGASTHRHRRGAREFQFIRWMLRAWVLHDLGPQRLAGPYL